MKILAVCTAFGEDLSFPPGGRLIVAALDYLVIAKYAADPGLQKAWRAFARDCTHRLKGLPPPAQAWIAMADEYDEGRVTARRMTAFRKADRFFEEHFKRARTVAARGALCAAKHRLWAKLDTEPGCWQSTAWHFIHWCAGAGVKESILVKLLRQHFTPFLADKGTSLRELIAEEDP